MIIAFVSSAIFLIGLFFFRVLLRRKSVMDSALNELDQKLKLRFDLIPNFVSTVKVHMKQEADALGKILELKSTGPGNRLPQAKRQELHRELAKGFSIILTRSEQFAELKSSDQFLKLVQSLQDAEAGIGAARTYFNQTVAGYNQSIEMFPSSILARMMGMKRQEIFHLPEIFKLT